jgi:hypothetical protein
MRRGLRDDDRGKEWMEHPGSGRMPLTPAAASAPSSASTPTRDRSRRKASETSLLLRNHQLVSQLATARREIQRLTNSVRELQTREIIYRNAQAASIALHTSPVRTRPPLIPPSKTRHEDAHIFTVTQPTPTPSLQQECIPTSVNAAISTSTSSSTSTSIHAKADSSESGLNRSYKLPGSLLALLGGPNVPLGTSKDMAAVTSVSSTIGTNVAEIPPSPQVPSSKTKPKSVSTQAAFFKHLFSPEARMPSGAGQGLKQVPGARGDTSAAGTSASPPRKGESSQSYTRALQDLSLNTADDTSVDVCAWSGKGTSARSSIINIRSKKTKPKVAVTTSQDSTVTPGAVSIETHVDAADVQVLTGGKDCSGTRPRRGTRSTVSYKEPSIRKKMRKGHIFFEPKTP